MFCERRRKNFTFSTPEQINENKVDLKANSEFEMSKNASDDVYDS